VFPSPRPLVATRSSSCGLRCSLLDLAALAGVVSPLRASTGPRGVPSRSADSRPGIAPAPASTTLWPSAPLQRLLLAPWLRSSGFRPPTLPPLLGFSPIGASRLRPRLRPSVDRTSRSRDLLVPLARWRGPRASTPGLRIAPAPFGGGVPPPPSRSDLAVSHGLAGFFRARAAGVATRCRPWGSLRFLLDVRLSSATPLPFGLDASAMSSASRSPQRDHPSKDLSVLQLPLSRSPASGYLPALPAPPLLRLPAPPSPVVRFAAPAWVPCAPRCSSGARPVSRRRPFPVACGPVLPGLLSLSEVPSPPWSRSAQPLGSAPACPRPPPFARRVPRSLRRGARTAPRSRWRRTGCGVCRPRAGVTRPRDSDLPEVPGRCKRTLRGASPRS